MSLKITREIVDAQLTVLAGRIGDGPDKIIGSTAFFAGAGIHDAETDGHPWQHLDNRSFELGRAWRMGTLRELCIPLSSDYEEAYRIGVTYADEHNPQPAAAEPITACFDLEAGPDVLPPHYKAIASTKKFNHEVGLSCAFRQWRAESHCRFLHGYALAFKFVFAAQDLDRCGWVVDFGGLKPLRVLLEQNFDHKTLVAADDPQLARFQEMHAAGMISLHLVPATGCEAYARMVYAVAEQWLKDAGFSPRVWLVSVEVSEHGANSAICQG